MGPDTPSTVNFIGEQNPPFPYPPAPHIRQKEIRQKQRSTLHR